jgi:hypothetical protein
MQKLNVELLKTTEVTTTFTEENLDNQMEVWHTVTLAYL